MFGNYGTLKCSSIRRKPAKLEDRKNSVIAFGRSGCQCKDFFAAKTSAQLCGAGKAKLELEYQNDNQGSAFSPHHFR